MINYNKLVLSQEELTQLKLSSAEILKVKPKFIPILVQIDSKVLKIRRHKFLVNENMNINNCIKMLISNFDNYNSKDTLDITVKSFKSPPPFEPTNLNNHLTLSLRQLYDRYQDPCTNMLIFVVKRITTYKWLKSFIW